MIRSSWMSATAASTTSASTARAAYAGRAWAAPTGTCAYAAHTDHGALRIDQIISRASRQAAKQSGNYTANLERALRELGCKVTRLESIS